MRTILDLILANKRKEVEALKQQFSYAYFEKMPAFEQKTSSLVDAINQSVAQSGFGIIAEIKRKSPSSGDILPELDVAEQGKAYEAGGAAAISCLTDFTYFGGSTADLTLLKNEVRIPVLRKEFIIDEMQLFEAKAFGADAVLLIAEALSKEEALHLTIIAKSLGMEVLMEVHEPLELFKLNDQVDLVGVNNRNLKIQQTSIENSFLLRPFLPNDKPLISESGIRTREEIERLKQAGYHGALIGESILKQQAPAEFIHSIH